MCKFSAPSSRNAMDKEAEIANSIVDLMTSRSITGGRDFPDYEMLDAKNASVLKKMVANVYFWKRVSVEEQNVLKKYDQFLRGRQMANMIYEYFRGSRADEVVQGLSDLFSTRLQNDDVQDFDTRWGPSSIISK